MGWRVLITSSHFDELCMQAKQLLESKGCKLEINHKLEPYYTFDELTDMIGDFDAAIVGVDDWNEKVLKVAKKLKVIARFGVGVDNIDLLKAKEFSITVVNARGENADDVAELVIGLILDNLRGISYLNMQMKDNQWLRHVGFELKGKTIGLIGFGHIAQCVAKKISGFDVKLLAYDVYPNIDKAKELNVKFVSEVELLEQSDIVTLLIWGSRNNYHYMNKEKFAKLKKGAFFINTARGMLVDTEALCDAVETGHIGGAAVDVYEEEPLPKDARILKNKKIITLPHSGAETYEAYCNIGLSTAKSVLDVLEGREPKNWLNK